MKYLNYLKVQSHFELKYWLKPDRLNIKLLQTMSANSQHCGISLYNQLLFKISVWCEEYFFIRSFKNLPQFFTGNRGQASGPFLSLWPTYFSCKGQVTFWTITRTYYQKLSLPFSSLSVCLSDCSSTECISERQRRHFAGLTPSWLTHWWAGGGEGRGHKEQASSCHHHCSLKMLEGGRQKELGKRIKEKGGGLGIYLYISI